MKNIKNLILVVGMFFLFLMVSCTNDEVKYQTSIVSDFEIQLNGEPWSLNTGISTKPIFIYKDNGEFFANYSSHYRFALDNGKYKFLATDIPEAMIASPINLNDLVINQDPQGDQKVNLSAVVPYQSPFDEKLVMNIITRTGTLRLKAKDIVADNSYSIIKTRVDVKRNGYKVFDETFVQGDKTVARAKRTTSGGINYTDDFILFQTDDVANTVRVHIDFMTQDSTIVKTKDIVGTFPVLSNTVTNVEFNLNDDVQAIEQYKVVIKDQEWTNETFNPAGPFGSTSPVTNKK